MNERRNMFDIIASIVSISKSGATKTKLVYRTETNFRMIQKYLPIILYNDFIYMKGNKYFITEKGYSYLDLYEKLNSMVIFDD